MPSDVLSRVSASRLLAAGALSIAVVALARWALTSGSLHYPAVVGGPDGLPLPIGFAVVILAYAWLWRIRAPEPAVVTTRAVIVLGLTLHALLLLSDLVPMVGRPAQFASRAYPAYLLLFCAAVSFAGAFVGVQLLRPPLGGRAAFYLPVIVAYVGLVARGTLTLSGVSRFALGAAALLGVGARLADRRAPDRFARLRSLASDDRFVGGATFVVALLLRLSFAYRIVTSPDFLATGSDGPLYDGLAWSVAQGEPINTRVGMKFPLLPHGYIGLVALVYLLGGRSYVLVCIVQAVLGALACVLAYAIATRLFGRPVGRLVAVFTAVDFPMIFAAAAIGHQALDVLLCPLGVWLLLRLSGRREPAVPLTFVTGLVLGWSVMSRTPNAIVLAFALGWVWIGGNRLAGRRSARVRTATLAAGALVVILPLFYITVIEPGNLQFVREQVARLFELGVRGMAEPELAPSAGPVASLGEVDQAPTAVVALRVKGMARNFAALFLGQDYGAFDLFFLARFSDYSRGMWFCAHLFTVVGVVLVALDIVRRRGNTWGLCLVLGFLASRTSVHAFFETYYRHRPPLEPFLIMLCAYGFARAVGLATGPTSPETPAKP